jgi:mRNA interferase MazF
MQNQYKQGDIVLVPYPYTDLSGSKQRPVIIISKNSINKENFIVAKITSVIRNDEFSFHLNLKVSSEVRTNELFTIHKTLIKKKFSLIVNPELKELITSIQENISVK